MQRRLVRGGEAAHAKKSRRSGARDKVGDRKKKEKMGCYTTDACILTVYVRSSSSVELSGAHRMQTSKLCVGVAIGGVAVR